MRKRRDRKNLEDRKDTSLLGKWRRQLGLRRYINEIFLPKTLWDDEKREYQNAFYAIVIGIYLIVSLWILSGCKYAFANPGSRFSDRLEGAFLLYAIHPPNLGIRIPNYFWAWWMIAMTLLSVIYWVVLSTYNQREHYNSDTAQGNAKWLKNLDQYNKRFTEPFDEISREGKNNIILSEKIFLSMDNQKTNRNLNVLVIGGSGAGKSYNFVGPNIMQANSSMVITDPSGGLFQQYGHFLEYNGYKVKCFNLSHMDRGCHYNPFRYIHSDKDIFILVNTLIQNTTPPDQKAGDPFWENAEKLLLNAVIAFLYHYSTPSEQTFMHVIELINAANASEQNENAKSTLDHCFEAVREVDPNGLAIQQYDAFKKGAGKTLKSILISVLTRLQAFYLSDVQDLTNTDDIDLSSIGDEKTALFIIIPTGESTFNFLASLMYSQLFMEAYDYCENEAPYSVLLLDQKEQVVKTYRAKNPEEAEEKRKEAEAFFQRCQSIKIRYNREFNWYEILTKKGELISYRGSAELADQAAKEIQKGRVVINSERSNHGQRLPVHLRLILDEFANIGKIPEFEKKVATIRKYEISVNIILQSLSQLKNMYKDNWSELAGNCDTTLYLGGGADTESAKWFSELLGKETRRVASNTFGKNGSMSLQKVGVDLMAASDVRLLEEKNCIVLMRSLYAYKGRKFKTPEHPMHSLVRELPPYYFRPGKNQYLIHLQEQMREKEVPMALEAVSSKTKEAIQTQEERDDKKSAREARDAEKAKNAAEQEDNKDAYQEPVVGSPKLMNEDNDEAKEAVSSPSFMVSPSGVVTAGENAFDGHDGEDTSITDYSDMLSDVMGDSMNTVARPPSSE